MIETNANKNSIKAIREKDRLEKETALRAQCEQYAIEKYGGEEGLKTLSNKHKGLWFLPIQEEDGGEIVALAIMKPIDRHILNYASTKMQEGGLYDFLAAAMNECFIEGDRRILEDDDFFIPASNSFNKILEGKKATLLKR